MTNKKRLQFDFNPEMVDRLERIRVKMHAASNAEVIRRALILLDFIVADNNQIILRDSKGIECVLKVL